MFDQLNSSLLNKSINFPKILMIPKLFNDSVCFVFVCVCVCVCVMCKFAILLNQLSPQQTALHSSVLNRCIGFWVVGERHISMI